MPVRYDSPRYGGKICIGTLQVIEKKIQPGITKCPLDFYLKSDVNAGLFRGKVESMTGSGLLKIIAKFWKKKKRFNG